MSENQIFPSTKRNKWIIYAALFAIASLALSFLHDSRAAYHLDGSTATSQEIRDASIKTLFLTIPILGFLIGLIVSLFPYRNASYRQKYLRSSILSILALEGLFFGMAIVGFLLRLIR